MSTTSFVMPNDLSDLCRVCLQLPEESQYLDLSTIYDEDDNLTYGECFTICTQIDLSAGEGVPHHLCKTCGLELQMSYDFHKKIEESKRVIEQCQREIAQQKEHSRDVLLQSNEDCNKLEKLERDQDNGLHHLIDNKYVISEDDVELAGTSQEMEDDGSVREHHHEEIFECDNTLVEEETDLEVLNKVCQNNITTNRDETEDVEVSNREAHEEELLDFQNMETLEEEGKTKLLQIGNKNYKRAFKKVSKTKKDILEIKQEIPNGKYSNMIINPAIKCEITIENERIISENITSEHKSSINDLNNSTERFFQCELCGHILPTKNALYKHRLRKHSDELKNNVKQNFKPTPTNTLLNCYLCKKVFKNNSQLRHHLKVGHTNTLFTCQYCGHCLPTKNALCQHRLRKHRDVEKEQKKLYKFKCPYCLEVFETNEGLKAHKTNHHVKNKLEVGNNLWFQCEDCGHKLPTKNALCQHRLRKHRNKKNK